MGVWDIWLDADKHRPAVPGWHPTLWVMPENEGVMPGPAHWDGEKWSGQRGDVDYFIDQVCQSEATATSIAYENDVEK